MISSWSLDGVMVSTLTFRMTRSVAVKPVLGAVFPLSSPRRHWSIYGFSRWGSLDGSGVSEGSYLGHLVVKEQLRESLTPGYVRDLRAVTRSIQLYLITIHHDQLRLSTVGYILLQLVLYLNLNLFKYIS